MRQVRWGVLGVAGIAVRKVIPAMQQGEYSVISAIASRDLAKAQDAASRLGVAKAYGSYEELLEDAEIDAVYNPLPNHLHVSWSERAAEAGKHVLCEKPIGLSVREAERLIEVRNRTGVKIGEAFMVRTHPQWLRAREIVRSGEIGPLRSVIGAFSYFNADPANIRNVAVWGGGGLMDIGCYPIQISRFLYGVEPTRACGFLDRDPEFGTDRLTSALLDFKSGQAIFTCGTQMHPFQKIQAIGTKGRIEVEIPFNAPPDRPARIFVDTGEIREETFPVCDQYTIQGDLFSKAVLGEGDVPTTLEDSAANMAVIETIVASERSGCWQSL